MEPRIYYLGWYGGETPKGVRKHDGVLTLAFREAGNRLHIGFSFCSPKDLFCRKTGRNEALRRMRNHPIVVKVLDNRRQVIQEVVKALCFGRFDKLEAFAESHDYQRNWVPNWANKWYNCHF